MRYVKLVLLLALLLVVGLVIGQNLEPVKTNLLVRSLEMPLAALLVCTLLIGYALGLLTAAVWKVRSWRAQALAARQLAAANKPAATEPWAGSDHGDSGKSILESRR
jgi:uncharacterized membrane protein YciS (DUF1049 family)